MSHQINSPVDPESASEGVWSDWSACQSQSGSAWGGQGRLMLTDAVEPTAARGAAMRRSHPALRRRANQWCTAANNTPMFVPMIPCHSHNGTVFPHVYKLHRESQPEDTSFIFLVEGNNTCCITLEEQAVRRRCSAPWASNTWSIITVDMINASLMN